jgi:hypothetical protein
MFRRKSVIIIDLLFGLTLAIVLLLVVSTANAQELSTTQSNSTDVASNKAETGNKETASRNAVAATPVYTGFMGVKVGMSAADVREKLGNLKDKGESQDFFVFSKEESAEVYYDDQGKVTAISIDYVGTNSEAPTADKVLGESLPVKPDGSIYGLKRYPEAGYWVAYSRTAGENPITTVTIQRL